MSYNYFLSGSNTGNLIVQNNNNLVQSDNLFGLNYRRKKENSYSPEFYKIRPEIIKRFSDRCCLCGEIGYEIHHIDYDKTNNNKNNLMLLCKSCHSKTNSNRIYWKECLDKKMKEMFCLEYNKEDYE